MPLLQSPPTPSYLFPLPFSQSISSPTYFTILSNKRFKFRRKSITTTFCSASEALRSTELYIERAVAEFNEDMETNRPPAVRIYENDLGRLTVIGDVSFEQALSAAAADGGQTATDHIVGGMQVMVVEASFPGPLDRSTIATRLFLPSRKVKEKAKRKKNAFPAEMLAKIGKRNILAMTFRQVVLQKVWSFELALFSPGARRNMEDLENSRELPALSTISSSDERVLSVLAEAVCRFALEKTETEIREDSLALGTWSNNIFHWFQRPTRNVSKDGSVCIYQLPQDEIIENAKKCLETFNTSTSYTSKEMKIKHLSWASSTYSKLEKIGGPRFSKWASEYVPAYRLQIDADKLKNIILERWAKSAENRWEVLLTHSQMVKLVEILDMYYEDSYTAPDKALPCRVVADFANLAKNKGSTTLWKKLSFTIACAILVISISALAQLYGPRLSKARVSPRTSSSVSLSEANCYKSVEATKVEGFCILIIKKIKDSVGWPGDVIIDKDLGAWTGELPSYLRLSNADLIQEVVSRNGEETVIHSFEELPLDTSGTDTSVSDKSINEVNLKSAQDIASYQVVLSKNGDIIGFQPTSLVGVNYWASNPLAKELYKGKKLSPGWIEPGLKIPRPDEFVVIELLVSVNPKSWFALARPIQ